MRAYVLTVDWFHDYDEVCPIDEFLCHWIALWIWHDSSGLCLPNPFPALKEVLSRWATLQIRSANKEYFRHCFALRVVMVIREEAMSEQSVLIHYFGLTKCSRL